ncbi:MAG TPA: hypothetical protein VN609_05830 [Propionibacteriaceae bacterium]|nr:hypothetical protein [Propionibacteriaceae bacterium]
MSAFAVMLIAIGIADACRGFRPRWVSVIIGPIIVVAVAALSALWHFGDIALLAVAVVAAVAWRALCLGAERTGQHVIAPLAVFAAATAILIVLSGWGSPVGGVIARWMSWTEIPVETFSATKLLMAVGVVLLQLVTGNQLVRLVLGSVGAVRPAGEPQPSDRLKGGRLLGPMERLLILGLGLGGQLAAASAVVAAKSIIRFPEINAQKARENGTIGIDDVTEYFLVGSFASWIVALGGLVLVLTQ